MYGGLTAGFASSLWLEGCSHKPAFEGPNIFIISVDTLRADHLSCYGYGKNTSPNIDNFSKEGLLFENCSSHASVTGSSLASLLSGFLPHETSVYRNHPLPKELEILPKTLKRRGYKTMAVVSNYALRKGRGWEKNFDVYDVNLKQREVIRRDHPERIAEYTTDRTIELINRYQKKQMFMWVHYQDPHGPYTPPKSFADKFIDPNQQPLLLEYNTDHGQSGQFGIPLYQRLGDNKNYHYYVAQYDAEINYMDFHFKRLIDGIKKLGLYKNSIIIFTSDHGEGMGEHDYYFAHGDHLYNGLTHVPLIIKYANQTGRIKNYVQHIDIVPTVLELIGLKPDLQYRGRFLLEEEYQTREIFAEIMLPLARGKIFSSLSVDGLKIVKNSISEKYRMFDLNLDKNEENDLINNPEFKEKSKKLLTRLRQISKENLYGVKIILRPDELTEEEKRIMKSHGYFE